MTPSVRAVLADDSPYSDCYIAGSFGITGKPIPATCKTLTEMPARKSNSQLPDSVIERRQRIIDTTRELIAEQGIEGITMRDLASRCSVAVATLYNQFGSREAIVAEALRIDFEGRFSSFPEDVGPVESLESRITESARAITGELRDYTRSVMFFYFHYKPDSQLRATIHDFVVADFTAITKQIAARDELQSWVNPSQFADDLVTQLYALASKCTQGYIPRRKFKQRLMLAAAASFAGISRGATRKEFEALAQRYQR